MEAKTKKTLITVGVVALIGIVVFSMFRKKANAAQVGQGSGSSGQPPKGASNLDFSLMADKLFLAMNNYGTNEGKIYDVFSFLKSDADFDALVAAYGTRELNCGSFNPFCENFNGNLIESLQTELSTGEIVQVNKILTNNGLTRRV